MEKIPVYVLNDFMKFERRLYSLFDMKLGRSITFKSIAYFAGAGAFLFVLSLLPLIGAVIQAVPLVVNVGAVGFFAYFLSDVGTENRSPLSAFRSFLGYHWRKLRKESYYKGQVMIEERPVKFTNLPTIANETPKPEPQGIKFKQGFTVR